MICWLGLTGSIAKLAIQLRDQISAVIVLRSVDCWRGFPQPAWSPLLVLCRKCFLSSSRPVGVWEEMGELLGLLAKAHGVEVSRQLILSGVACSPSSCHLPATDSTGAWAGEWVASRSL